MQFWGSLMFPSRARPLSHAKGGAQAFALACGAFGMQGGRCVRPSARLVASSHG